MFFSLKSLTKTALLASAVVSSGFADSFTDYHNNHSLDGWTTYGARQWLENDTIASPTQSSNSTGFLINNHSCGNDGMLEVVMRADQWNGQKGGVVFRWTSANSFYYVALQPGNQYSNYLKFVKNSLDVNAPGAITVAQNFSISNKFTLKIEMNGSTFKFYINNVLKGQVTDASLPTGQVGYGYAAEWNDYIDYYNIKWTEAVQFPKFLIIISSPLYRAGTIASDLAQYQQDIAREGWTSKIITVNKAADQFANVICHNEKELKLLIQYYYYNGLKGFVLVGSPNDIPTAYWSYHEKVSDKADPTDLYYADVDEWFDLDGNNIYETYYSKWDSVENRWVEDKQRPANPLNPNFIPDLMFGRISPDSTVNSIGAQASMVSKYFLKVHNYRVNGSNLTAAEQERSLYLRNEGYSTDMSTTLCVQSATRNFNLLSGYTLLFPDRISAELRKGFMHAQIVSHSGENSHAGNSWKNEVKTWNPYTLDSLKTSGVKIHQVNMYCCLACRFVVPNFGATYLFNTDYTLNVTGSTGSWGTMMDEPYYTDLNKGVPVGGAYNNWCIRWGSGDPRGVLHGDPLLTYRHPLVNKAPMLVTKLLGLEAKAGQTFNLSVNARDPENDPVTIQFLDLPEGAQFTNNTLTWTPAENLAGTTDTITVRAFDIYNNTVEQSFTIYVSHFQNGNFAGTTGWNVSGTGCIATNDSSSGYDTPYGICAHPVSTNNGWASLSQTVKVKPNTRYRFSFWCSNKLTMNNDKAFIRVNELNTTIPVPVTKGNEFEYCSSLLITDDNSTLTFTLNNGSPENLTSGNVYTTLLRLVELGNDYVENGGFENATGALPDMWINERWQPTSEMKVEKGTGLNGSNCISIYHQIRNDSRFVQTVGLIPGKSYILKGFIKGENIVNVDGGTIGASICINDNQSGVERLTGTFDWKEIRQQFTAPASGTISLACKLGHGSSTTTGKAWFDNVSIVPE